MKRQTAAGEITPHLVPSPDTQKYERWMVPNDPPGTGDGTVPQLHSLALEALAQIQAVLQINTTLVHQSAALEEQVQLLLAERIALFERIDLLEEQLAQLSQQTARVADRQPIPFRPLANLPAALHHERLEAVAFTRRFSRAALSDEETLLSDSPACAAPPPASLAPAFPATASRDYTLIARPFARFTDLGGFQEAVQRLPSIHNVRVRRFAQGTLEMRLDYDGDRPLADLLRGLALPVEEVTQEEPALLRIRLTSLEDRMFSALS